MKRKLTLALCLLAAVTVFAGPPYLVYMMPLSTWTNAPGAVRRGYLVNFVKSNVFDSAANPDPTAIWYYSNGTPAVVASLALEHCGTGATHAAIITLSNSVRGIGERVSESWNPVQTLRTWGLVSTTNTGVTP